MSFEGFPGRHWRARAKRPTWTEGTSSVHPYGQLCVHHPSHKSTESSPVTVLQGLQGTRGPPGPLGPQGTQVSHLTPKRPFYRNVSSNVVGLLPESGFKINSQQSFEFYLKTKIRLNYDSGSALDQNSLGSSLTHLGGRAQPCEAMINHVALMATRQSSASLDRVHRKHFCFA